MAIDIRGLTPLLLVFDMRTAVRFYRDVLGFEVIQTSEPGDEYDWALLSLHGAALMLNAAYERHARPPAPDPRRIAAHADTAIYFACRDLDGLHAHLRAHGADARPPGLTGYGFRAVHVKDPDGYQLTFHWPTRREEHDRWVERYGLAPAAADEPPAPPPQE